MKKRSYRNLILADVLFLGLHIANFVLNSPEELLLPSRLDGYVQFCLISMIVHGIATYCVYHRILIPHLITGSFVAVSVPILFVCSWREAYLAAYYSVTLSGFFLLSLVASLLAKGIEKWQEWRKKQGQEIKKWPYRNLILADALFLGLYGANFALAASATDPNSFGSLVLGHLLFSLIGMIVHGIATYCVYRRVLIPHLITGSFVAASAPILFICTWGKTDLAAYYSTTLSGFFLLSLVSSLLCGGVFLLAKRVRQWREGRKKQEGLEGPSGKT